jgi:hypothetical protein
MIGIADTLSKDTEREILLCPSLAGGFVGLVGVDGVDGAEEFGVVGVENECFALPTRRSLWEYGCV